MMQQTEVLPNRERPESKKVQVSQMFDDISGNYDFLNHFLSFGIDKRWRKKAIKHLAGIQPKSILDVATGTGDLAIEALKLSPEKIVGIDISDGMLEIGRQKIINKGLSDRIELLNGDSENIPFEENKFDGVTVAFGVRNFENLEKGLAEIFRVMKPEGMVVILEFSRPSRFPFKQLYHFYFQFILPKIGRWISRNKDAYRYLPESVNAFPNGEAFTSILTDTGFKKATWQTLTFGISSIYTARK